MTVVWNDGAKIDGNKIKGFVKTTSGKNYYAIYQFQNEQEKNHFSRLHLPAVQFTVSGAFEASEFPSHPYAFNMENYLKMYGAAGIVNIETITDEKAQENITSRLAARRQKVRSHIKNTFPENLVPEAEALLIGDRSGMSEEDSANYRKLGITHLFAISGLHVGLLTMFVRGFLLRLKVRKENVDIFLIAALPLYAVIAGGAPSIWRAVIVSILILLALYSRLPIRLDSILALSAIGFMIMKPYVIFQPGFQLSYLAALSLILSSKILSEQKSNLKVSFLITAISQLPLYPVLLFHFYEVSLSSFIVNLLYVPLYSIIILPANIILLILTFIAKPIADCLFYFYVPFRYAVQEITTWLAALPYQLWTPGKPGLLANLIAIGGIFRFYILYEDGKSVKRGLFYVLIPALFIHFLPYLNNELRVTYLDVGQGDSIVIELPHKRAVYVIDTGGTVPFGEKTWKTPENEFKVGRKIVMPYLKGRGIAKVDKLILTHAHLDHMGGADEIIEDIRVGEIHITPNSYHVKEMEDAVQAAIARKVPIIEKKDGMGWTKNEYRFYYVSPQNENYTGNDSSLVLYMTTAGPSFLFTGDMEENAERKFLSEYGNADLGEIILKVGHHGSRTSSTDPFVKRLRPVLAVISAGRNNHFGHPHEDVLMTFQKYGVPVLATSDSGSITVRVKNEDFTVTAMR